MAKDYAIAFYKSTKWIKCRKAYIEIRVMVDGGMCEECNKAMGYIVHHKEEIREDNINDPNITLNYDNFKYVCKQCHDEYEGHGLNKSSESLCIFDDEGNPIATTREIDNPP